MLLTRDRDGGYLTGQARFMKGLAQSVPPDVGIGFSSPGHAFNGVRGATGRNDLPGFGINDDNLRRLGRTIDASDQGHQRTDQI